jgi:hypothetical protein
MAYALGILLHTPAWVFVLLALLVLLGLQATRPRTVSLRRAVIAPAVFIGWGLIGIAQKAQAQPSLLAVWLVGLAGGALFAHLSAGDDLRVIDRARGTVALPGSWRPLLRYLAIFAVRYGFAVTGAVAAPAERAMVVVWDMGAAGLVSGYFLAGLVGLLVRWRRTPLPEGAT